MPLGQNGFVAPKCEAALRSTACSDYDRAALQRQADCLNSLPVCAHGGEQAWTDAWWACEAIWDRGVQLSCPREF